MCDRCGFPERVPGLIVLTCSGYSLNWRPSLGCSHGRSTTCRTATGTQGRSEEHTSELQSLMRISYAVFCLKKKRTRQNYRQTDQSYHIKIPKKSTRNEYTTTTTNITNYYNRTPSR